MTPEEIERQKLIEHGRNIERRLIMNAIDNCYIPMSQSPAGEMAAEWTLDALNELRNKIRGDSKKDVKTIIEQCHVDAREKLAAWMWKNALATGHGDTIDDLLNELQLELNDIRSKQRKG